MIHFERAAELLRRRGIAKSKHFADIADGLWVRPVHDGRAALFPVHESNALLAAKAAGATHDQIRKLVDHLHTERERVGGQVLATLSDAA